MNKVITVGDVLPRMEPNHQDVLKGMLVKAGIPEDESVFEALKKFVYSDLYKDWSLEQKKALIPLMSWDREKFAPKLSYQQRCEVLALHHSGISRDLLSRAYGIDRRTVTHIYNPKSAHYREVRQEFLGLGAVAFSEKYVTQHVMDRVLAFKKRDPEANKGADRRSGPHTILGENTATPHKVVIAWKDTGDEQDMNGERIIKPGWYYNDLDGEFPNCWLYDDDDSLRSSDACYKAMLRNIRDKE